MKTDLKTISSESNYIIMVAFERNYADDMEVMKQNHLSGKIGADPTIDFDLAAKQQLTLELVEAYNAGELAGSHQCTETIKEKCFDYKAMGWH